MLRANAPAIASCARCLPSRTTQVPATMTSRTGVLLPEKRIALADLVHGKVKGRTSNDQITYSERGNLQGAQFFAVAGRVYELAKKAGLGREIPTEWFLQTIRN